ncbi:MAG: glycosyltransferase family 2 protein, partial [Armatimonadota bacterium]|nr:glycosyltransferase family 2 protein [Armatimonadota bacterium]
MERVTLSVIIPAYNERDTIAEAIRRVQEANLGDGVSLEILVVDDCSTDGTREVLRGIPGIRVLQHERNQGKGAAIRTALAHASGDVVVIQDADLEYDPADLRKMLEPIRQGKTAVVYGSRFLKSRPQMRRANYVANRILAWAATLLFFHRITDEATCYKMFRADVLRAMNLKARRFEFCPEVTAKALRAGYRIVEVPISYRARTVAEGKKISWKDGFSALWT